LTGYLQYQRDIGVDGIVFGHGSAVRKILSGGGGQPAKRVGGAGADARPGGYPPGASVRTPAVKFQPGAAAAPAGDDSSPLSKLSKIRTVDAIDVKKPVKRSRKKAPAPSSERREKLAGFYREIVDCGKCALSHHRTKAVFGSGSADGKLVVIGDAPEPPEDAAGLPFQGEAGELFDRILEKMGLDRKNDIFAAYVQKCWDLYGFNAECAEACKPYLDRQIDVIEPKAILVFGQAAANFLLGNGDAIEQLRAINHTYKDRPVVVTYDLQLMLKEKQRRFDAWEDMKKILTILNQ